MPSTAYPHVNDLLDHLLAQLHTLLGEKLVGLYLHGSLVTGDYDQGISDVDLLAALSSDLDEPTFNALQHMHADIVRHDPQWDNHLEIAYLSLHALKTFKTHVSPIGIISPGEPFHIIDAGKDWLVNWYMVREKGLTLWGPPPTTIIEPISKEEFVQVVREHVRSRRAQIDEVYHRGAQAYLILTLCRALYTCTHGEQISKVQAARWAEQELPEWSAVIQNAVVWRQQTRQEEPIDHESTLPETRRFVHFMIDYILG